MLDYPESNVRKVDIGLVPEAAISGAMLLQDESSSYLLFNAMKITEDGRRKDAGVAVIELVGCWYTTFGYPNDEARFGIPRYKNVAYDVCEVINSPWIKEITRLNRYSFPNTKESTKLHHFVFGFHDSTFECICQTLKVEAHEQQYSEVARSICGRLRHP